MSDRLPSSRGGRVGVHLPRTAVLPDPPAAAGTLPGIGAAVSNRRLVVAFVAVTSAAGLAAALLDWRLLVPVGAGLPLAAAAVLTHPSVDPRRTGPPGGLAPSEAGHPGRHGGAPDGGSLLHRVGTLAGIWTALFFVTTIKLIEGARSVDAAATGQLSADNLLELVVTLTAGLVVASAVRNRWPVQVPPAAWLLGAYTVLAVGSVTWSRLPLLSSVRAFQLVVMAAFTAYCAGRAALEPGLADRLFGRVLRYTAFVAVALAAYGVLDGALDWERFTWRGTHPNAAAALMLVPCMGLLFHPRRASIVRPVPWWLLPLGLLPLIYLTGSRANVAGAAVAVFCGWFVAAMRDRQVGAHGIGLMLVLLGTGWGVASDRLAGWLLRGQSTETVTGLNGRMELWEWVLENPLGSEIWGIGIGAARGVLPVSWNPTNVHSSWIDILQTLGVLGLAVMGAVVLTVLAVTLRRRSVHAAWMVAYVTLSSINSITISLPNYGLVLVCLSIVVLSGTGTSAPRTAVAAGSAAPALTDGPRSRTSASS